MFVLGALLPLVLCGCAATPVPSADPYLIVVKYDVEPELVGVDRGRAVRAIRRDFHAIASLGFNGVVLRHVEDADRLTLLEIAHEANLMASVPDRHLEHFVLTGTLPVAYANEDRLTRTLPKGITKHPALSTWIIHPGRSAAATGRAASVAAHLREHGVECNLVGGGTSVQDGERLTRIDPAVFDARPEGSPLEQLLAQYHAGLTTGRTSGVVIDRFHRLPGDPRGLISTDKPARPARTAAIRALLARARHWGPRLCEFAAQPIAAAATPQDELQLTALVKGQRRYVLVYNPAGAGYARSDVVLPQSIGGAVAARAVEVPPSTDRKPGHVVDAQRRHVTLSVSLRPGDAALFEIF